jgi:transcriptional regulator
LPYLRGMYSLPYFKEKELGVVKAFMEQHPFITLCGSDAAGNPVATHVPVLLREENGRLCLHGHIMKKTDHHLAFEQNPNVLAIFSGPHTYVSASWYSNPQQGSTWNYMTVHAKGVIQFLGEAELLNLLRDLTARFENNTESPALFDKLPREYISQMSKAIVAFEIEVKEIDNVFKLSQNRDEASYHTIIKKLEQQGGDAGKIAGEMSKRAEKLFSEKPVKTESAGHE